MARPDKLDAHQADVAEMHARGLSEVDIVKRLRDIYNVSVSGRTLRRHLTKWGLRRNLHQSQDAEIFATIERLYNEHYGSDAAVATVLENEGFAVSENQVKRARKMLGLRKRRADAGESSKDWSAKQYLKFAVERTQAVYDLLARLPPNFAPKLILDLGCGPGNSTSALRERYPDAHIIGVDSSPDMIVQARKRNLPDVDFVVSDLTTYTLPPLSPAPQHQQDQEQKADLVFANAVYQWLLPHSARLSILKTLIRSLLRSDGVFAFQVPNNFAEPSHALMRAVAARDPWQATLCQVPFPWRDAFQSPPELYAELAPLFGSGGAGVQIWETTYWHWLRGPGEIVEWVRGTGLRPFEQALRGEERRGFLKAYGEEIGRAYPVIAGLQGERVGFRFPRLFFVGVRG